MTAPQRTLSGTLAVAASCFLAVCPNSLAQGVFLFQNVGANGGARAPIYGPEPGNPSLQLWGNPLDALPPGNQSYSGPLIPTNYSVEAWYTLAPVGDVSQLIPNARPVAGSLTSPHREGYFIGPSPLIPDPNRSQDPGYPYYVYLQVRAWDNAGGHYPSWDSAWSAARAGSGTAVGWSQVFYQPLDRDASTFPYPGLDNFQSFNLFIVPEPTSASLFVAGAIVFRFFRRPYRR